jgi:hypothetical protein
MKLADLQAMFQTGVLAGAEDGARILDSVKNSGQADRTTLFGVYVNAYRARLAEFLAADFPALTDAFDAPDAEPLAIDALGAFTPEQWPRLSFAFHPSLILLELEAGTIATHEAAIEQQEPPPRDEGRGHAAVWRADLDSVHCELEADEFLALSLAMEGHAFGDICQMAAFRDLEDASPERLAQMLAGWFQEGLVVRAQVSEEE